MDVMRIITRTVGETACGCIPLLICFFFFHGIIQFTIFSRGVLA